ncbi:zinc finger MYM-type protein 1-like, partial [Aphis craccivora]
MRYFVNELLHLCQNSDSLIGVLLKFLNCLNLDKINIIGQSNDGASVMSGHTGGVQAKLKEIHPKAIYVHYMAHKLNLVVIDMCKHLKDARNLFNGLEALYVHLSQPTKNKKKLTKLQKTFKKQKSHSYQKLDGSAVIRVKIELQKDKDVAQAIGLLSTIKNGKFVVHLLVLNDILKIINILSTQLQSKSTTLGKSKHDVSLDIPSQGGSKRRRREPTYLQQYAVLSTTSAEENRVNDVLMGTSTNKNYWKMHCFYPILDTIIVNMEKRFSKESMEV